MKNQTDSGFEINVEADTISMKSVLTTSKPITFVSELNKLLGFTSKTYSEETHKSESQLRQSSSEVQLCRWLNCEWD